jgi:hypothetical protein
MTLDAGRNRSGVFGLGIEADATRLDDLGICW